MKLILAHDSFTQLGGAERVFLEMCKMFPEAPIFTLACDKKVLDQLPPNVVDRIHTTPLQYLYNLYPKFQHLLPFIPLALWLTKIPQCDILLSSSSAFAKGFKKPVKSTLSADATSASPPLGESSKVKTIHINYCHTPTRFLWINPEYFFQEVPKLVRLPARLFLWWMKKWDKRIVSRVDIFLSNSKEVQARIKKYYDRESEVVYPFVDVQYWEGLLQSSQMQSPPFTQTKYFLLAGRLHAHKDNDLVIRACNELKLNLIVIGSGRDEIRLKSLAGPTITFLGRTSDEVLALAYKNAEAFIYPQLEDFGLMPLEAASCGTPTIGLDEGGTGETIVPNVTGEWFKKGDLDNLKRILENFDKSRYDAEVLKKHARSFSVEKFKSEILRLTNI